jgi:hypothetical protein
VPLKQFAEAVTGKSAAASLPLIPERFLKFNFTTFVAASRFHG